MAPEEQGYQDTRYIVRHARAVDGAGADRHFILIRIANTQGVELVGVVACLQKDLLISLSRSRTLFEESFPISLATPFNHSRTTNINQLFSLAIFSVPFSSLPLTAPLLGHKFAVEELKSSFITSDISTSIPEK